MDLLEARVLVTGASSGIGRATASAFAHEGCRVAVTARRADRLEQLAAEIEESGATRPTVIAGNLSVRGEAARVADAAVECLGGIDVLVNCAGSGVSGTVWAVGDANEARSTFEVDVWSPAALISKLVPAMRDVGRGAVVNVTSISQVTSWTKFGFNAAAKAALGQLTETLRLELVGSGVHVVEVVAGPVQTPVQAPVALMPGLQETLREHFGEIGEPEVLASQITAAVADEAEYVFYPSSVEDAYRDPVKARSGIRAAVQSAGLPRDDQMADMVIGSDHPFSQQVRAAWEREHLNQTN